MNQQQLMAAQQQQLALAQQRLARARIPQGAHLGALAGQQQQAQAPAVPQGAEDGKLAGCGTDGGCGPMSPNPFAGDFVDVPYYNPQALLGVIVQPAAATPVALEIVCGPKFFNACGGRYFGNPGENIITSVNTSWSSRNRFCEGGGVDAAFFITDKCLCPFYFGCFSPMAPMLLTFDPVDTQSNLAPFNFVFGGVSYEMDGCFPIPPAMPVPTSVPGVQYPPNVTPPFAGPPAMTVGAQPNPMGYQRWF